MNENTITSTIAWIDLEIEKELYMTVCVFVNAQYLQLKADLIILNCSCW